MKKQLVGLAIVGLVISVFFQNCSRPVSFQESAPLDFSSLSVSGLVINNGDIYTKNSVVTLSLEVGNSAEMYITNSPDCSSGGEWVPATEQISWELNSLNTDSAVFAKFRSTYQKESPCMSDSIIHDNIAPVISLQNALPAKTNQASTSISLSTSDSGSGVERIYCPASIASCSNTVSSSNAADGVKSFSFYVTDRAGNRSADLNASYLVDRTPPTLLIAQKPPDKTSSQTANFLFSGSDQFSSVVTYKCQMNGGAFVSCPANYSISGLAEGNYSLNVVALDDLGNTSAPQNASWMISRKLPGVRITKSPAIYTNQKESVEFAGEDQFGGALVKFECQLNGGSWSVCVSPVSLASAALLQGVNSFKVRGTDSGGLVSGDEQVQWNYDTVLPSLSFVTKPSPFTNKANENAVVAVAGNEAVELVFKLDGNVIPTSVPGSYSFNPSEASHAILVVATDKAGNKSADLTANFISDFTKPSLLFSNAFPVLPTPTASNALNFGVTAQDTNTAPGNNLSTFYSMGDLENSVVVDSFKPFTPPFSLANITHGSHQLKFYVKDMAGNQSDQYLSNPFLVDLISPVISFLVQPPASTRPNTPLTIKYLVEDIDSGLAAVGGTKCKLSINGIYQPEEACNASATVPFTSDLEAKFVFTITATDAVGRVAVRSVGWEAVEEFQAMNKPFTVAANNNNKVDILFVRDNSHSMKDEQTLMANAFSNFLTNLGDIDYRIAVITTDVALTNAGLQEMGSAGTYVSQGEPNGLAALQAGLIMNTNQSGDETGLTTIMKFVAQTKVAGTEENDFYRPGAVLATVVLSDSDEAEREGYPSADLFLADFAAALPNKVYINHSVIILPGDSACLNEDNDRNQEYGYTYVDVSNITGGNSVSICSPNYGNELKDFATKIIGKVSEQILDCNPIDYDRNGSVDMTITYAGADGTTGTLPASSYSVLQNRVRFASPLTVLGNYNISFYCVK